MGFCSLPLPNIPYDTSAAAQKVYEPQNIYVRIGNQLERLLTDINVQALTPEERMHQHLIFRLALVTAFQYAEILPDSMAADATLKRLDWKYALRLPVIYPGISAQALCYFRRKLLASPAAEEEYTRLLGHLKSLGLSGVNDAPLPETRTLLSTICKITRLYRIRNAVKATLSMIAAFDADLLRASILPHWYERYKTDRLVGVVGGSGEALEAEAVQMGKDLFHILKTLKEQPAKEKVNRTILWEIDQLLKEEFILSGDRLQWQSTTCAHCTGEVPSFFIH